jgi:hypothetical protein
MLKYAASQGLTCLGYNWDKIHTLLIKRYLRLSHAEVSHDQIIAKAEELFASENWGELAFFLTEFDLIDHYNAKFNLLEFFFSRNEVKCTERVAVTRA